MTTKKIERCPSRTDRGPCAPFATGGARCEFCDRDLGKSNIKIEVVNGSIAAVLSWDLDEGGSWYMDANVNGERVITRHPHLQSAFDCFTRYFDEGACRRG